MPIHGPGASQKSETETVIQMAHRHEQLKNIADFIQKAMNEIPHVDVPLDYLNLEMRRRIVGYCDTIYTIAQELRTQPDQAILAQRIYDKLKDHAAAGAFARHMVPSFVHADVLAILTDEYAHLNTLQREAIKTMTADIMSAGDGDPKRFNSEARGEVSNWSIKQMLEWTQLEHDKLCKRLKFDPETGDTIFERRGGVMSKEQSDELYKKFPVLLEKQRGPFTEGRGWYSLLTNYLQLLDNIRSLRAPNLRVTQVKEKFGRLTIYTSGATSTTAMEVREIEGSALRQSASICERCGSTDGTVIDAHRKEGGWVKALCTNCSGYVEEHPEERMIPREGETEE